MLKHIGLVLLTLATSACWRIPGDFHQHTLPEKIAIYERHFRLGGLPNQGAEWSIAWHGDAAADAMIPYLTQQRTGLTVVTATLIVQDVAVTGCDLKGSRVEAVLQRLSTDKNLRPYERSPIQITLSTIAGALPPLVPASHYGFGACAKYLPPPPKTLSIKIPNQ